MPKVCLTDSQKDNDILLFNMGKIKGGRNWEEIAKLIGVSKSSWYNRILKDPQSLTIREVKALCRYFKVDPGIFITRKFKLN